MLSQRKIKNQSNPNNPNHMNKELLNNPEVKEIAQKFALNKICKISDFTNSYGWDDFVRENTKPKEWEILRFKHNTNDKILELRGDGTYWYLDEPNLSGCNLNEMLNDGLCVNSGGLQIHSVKRLSDGEVFTLLDEAHCGRIAKFELDGNLMYARGVDFKVDIRSLKKAKQPLFKTFDNEFIYDNDDYFHVDDNFKLNYYLCSATWGYPNDYTKTCFKDKLKAEEYILINKPKLSIQSLLNSGAIVKGSPQYNQIVELAKTIE